MHKDTIPFIAECYGKLAQTIYSKLISFPSVRYMYVLVVTEGLNI